MPCTTLDWFRKAAYDHAQALRQYGQFSTQAEDAFRALCGAATAHVMSEHVADCRAILYGEKRQPIVMPEVLP